MNFSTDIDIDFPDREKALKDLLCIQATNKGRVSKHPSGVYFQNIPIDPVDGLAAYDHKEAEDHGFFKIDFLKNSIYEGVRDEEHLDRLLNTEPVWELFENASIVSDLAQIGDHFNLVSNFKPKSIEELAVCLALMRPGKRHLQKKTRAEIMAEIWKPSEQYYYKKPHAIAYAASIVVQLNLIVENVCGG